MCMHTGCSVECKQVQYCQWFMRSDYVNSVDVDMGVWEL
jgi:hypothetical protein